MKVFLLILFSFCVGPAFNQFVSNVNLLQHTTYMIKVVEETVQDLEDYGWCNLKIRDFAEDLSYSLFGRNVSGTVTYKNGFVYTIQHLDVLGASVQQKWTWSDVFQTGVVALESQLRLHDVVLGFDVDAVLDEERHRYTAKVKHKLININFAINTFVNMNQTIITVTIPRPNELDTRISYIPSDEYSDIIGALYDHDSTRDMLAPWANVIQPILTNVVANKVAFPTICYDCAA